MYMAVVSRSLNKNKNETRRWSSDGTLRILNTLAKITLYYRYNSVYAHFFFNSTLKFMKSMFSCHNGIKEAINTKRYIGNFQVSGN